MTAAEKTAPIATILNNFFNLSRKVVLTFSIDNEWTLKWYLIFRGIVKQL